MAKTNIPSMLLLLATLFLSTMARANPDARFYKTLNPRKLGLKREKLTHLHFFFHDIVSGKNPTAVPVASAPTTNSSATFFGFMAMIDDPLTSGPEPGSRRIGAAQGIYASASQTEEALLMVQIYVFTAGKYNGSTLSVLARNAGFTGVRELAIVGGSGIFRFARGYVLAETYDFNNLNDSVMEYNVYVLHY